MLSWQSLNAANTDELYTEISAGAP